MSKTILYPKKTAYRETPRSFVSNWIIRTHKLFLSEFEFSISRLLLFIRSYGIMYDVFRYVHRRSAGI